MKRILAVLLAAILLLGAFACGDKTDRSSEAQPTAGNALSEPTAEPAETSTPAPTEAPTPAPTEVPLDSNTALWKQIDAEYPALRSAVSQWKLNPNIWDPSAYGIDVDTLIPIHAGSVEEYEQYFADLRALMNHVCEVDRFQLNDADLFAFTTVTESLKSEMNGREFILFNEPFAPNSGWQIVLLNVFVSYRIASAEDIESYLAMLSYIPTYLDKLLAREQARIDEWGWFLTEAGLDQVLSEIETVTGPGKDFFGYAYLGKCMDALGMSSEEQAPYLARNEAAVDGVVAAYQNLYTVLDGLRPHCENERTPYGGVPSVENNKWYRSYRHWLTRTTGFKNDPDPFTIDLFYDSALQFMAKELNETVFPNDAAEKAALYRNKTPKTHYSEILGLLEAEYGPLSGSCAVQDLPELEIPVLGCSQFKCYVDNPDAAVLYFSNAADDSSVMTRYGVCYSYFYRYFLQQPTLSRAQIFAAPGTYYSGLSFYAALMLTKAEAERTHDYTDWYNLFYYIYNYVLIGYTANLITQGYGCEEIKEDLSEFYQVPQDFAEAIYSTARANPLYMLDITYGFVRLYLMREGCKAALARRFSERQFFLQYLSYGPSFPDMLEEKVSDWLEGMRSSSDT